MGRTQDLIEIIVVILLAIFLFIVIFWLFYRKKKRNWDWDSKRALWFQELTRRFQERFPDQPFHSHESDPFTIVVPPKHLAVAGLRICDGGNNIIVEIGEFTHEHFDKAGLWGAEQSNWEDVRESMEKGIWAAYDILQNVKLSLK